MPTTVLRVERIKGGDGDGDIKTASATEKEHYLVTFSDYNATAVDARTATSSNGSVPVYGAQLTTIAGTVNLYLTGKTATRSTANPAQWVVDCTYTTPSAVEVPPKPSGWSSGDKYGVQVNCRGVPYTEEIQKDINGKPCTNCLGEPLNPPITRTTYDKQIEVVFFVDKLDQTTIDACIGAANNASVTMTIGASTWTFATNTLKFEDYAWETNFDPDGSVVFRVTFIFLYRKDGWYDLRTNSSFYQAINPRAGIGTVTITARDTMPITDGQPTPQKILLGSITLTGAPVVQPRFLDSTGAPLSNGSSVTLANGGLLQFQSINTVSFTTLLSGVP